MRSESEAARDYNWTSQRSWKVVNPNRTNAVGGNVAYKLVPSASIPPLMDPAAPQYLRAPVIGHTVWVTRHHDDERWPCGAYPTQSDSDHGMTRWIADDEPLENADVVLWYVFGIHHVTRMEDWPVMPADIVSFWLKPSGVLRPEPVHRRRSHPARRERALPHRFVAAVLTPRRAGEKHPVPTTG